MRKRTRAHELTFDYGKSFDTVSLFAASLLREHCLSGPCAGNFNGHPNFCPWPIILE